MNKKKEDKKKARLKVKDMTPRKQGEGIKGGTNTIRSTKSNASE